MTTNVVQVDKERRYTDIVPKSQDTTITKRKRRPARRQVDARKTVDKAPPQTGQIFNIWYGKWSGGDKEDKYAIKDQAETKCDPVRDSGWTKGDKVPGTHFCLFFARGCCPHGPDCLYLHRLPQPTDMFTPNVDCFGRDKHADYRDDMGGVGSFLQQNHTLYVARIATTDDIEEVVSEAFCQWGEVERIRVLNSRGLAFVTYVYQNSAEFAKEAMAHQPLKNNETINVRWASQDPNNNMAARDAKRAEEQAVVAIRRLLPQEFLDELEGTGEKKQRLDYGLEGYQPPDELWYQRGAGAVNPAGRTKAIEGSTTLTIEAQPEPVDQPEASGIFQGRTLTALKSLGPAPAKVKEKITAKPASGLVGYGSDEDD